MNKIVATLLIFFLAGTLLPVWAQTPKAKSYGEEFMIISSIDQPKSQVVFALPTQVTLLMTVNDKTGYLDEHGAKLKLSDLHAGDTVWVTSHNAAGSRTALRIRKGPMTVADLHRLYLNPAKSY